MIVFITIPIEINFGDIKVLWNIIQSVLINLAHLYSSPAIFFWLCMYKKNCILHISASTAGGKKSAYQNAILLNYSVFHWQLIVKLIQNSLQ